MLVHRTKVRAHQLIRGIRDRIDLQRPRPGTPSRHLVGAPIVAEVVSPLWYAQDPREWILQAGKVENLRVARTAFHGVELAAGQVFSFWAHLGRPSSARGFVPGREIREGCVVPAIAGGICQLSNALYGAALDAGLEILERHAHSRVLPGSAAARDRDATVLWNYIDLRFVAAHAMRLEVELTADTLVVRLRGHAPRVAANERPPRAPGRGRLSVATLRAGGTCLSCDNDDCHRSVPAPPRTGERAFIVDGVWPELDAFVRTTVESTDHLILPMDGARWGRERYAWCSGAFDPRRVHTFAGQVVRRAVVSRRLAQQGAARQHALLTLDARLANAMARCLRPEITRLVVSQSLLPHLWAAGHLAGRRFDVLATRLPLRVLQARLDAAARRNPCSTTAADFRAEPWLVDAESEALAAAGSVVTPHAAIADECGTRAIHVPWAQPERPAITLPGKRRLGFPATTVARKGCYELREAIVDLQVELVTGNALVEAPDFWRDQNRGPAGPVDLVVLPAWVEHAPRMVLAAVAAGVPAIASTACGLRGVPGVTEVVPGDVGGLRSAIQDALDQNGTTRLSVMSAPVTAAPSTTST